MTNTIVTTDNQPIDAEIVESTNSQLVLSSLQQAFSNEDALIIAWLKEKSPVTARNYMGAVRAFLDFGGSINKYLILYPSIVVRKAVSTSQGIHC